MGKCALQPWLYGESLWDWIQHFLHWLCSLPGIHLQTLLAQDSLLGGALLATLLA